VVGEAVHQVFRLVLVGSGGDGPDGRRGFHDGIVTVRPPRRCRDTASKTRDVLKRAKGGILFIEEAYYLYRPENERDYGQEGRRYTDLDNITK
jgi:hypothetical protein